MPFNQTPDLSHDQFMKDLRPLIGEGLLTDVSPIWFQCLDNRRGFGPAMLLPSFYAGSFVAQPWHSADGSPITAFALKRRR
jgi:hypothetical protein